MKGFARGTRFETEAQGNSQLHVKEYTPCIDHRKFLKLYFNRTP